MTGATKGALDTFTAGLVREAAHAGIRVNGVRLGIFDTDLHASSGRPTRAWDLAPSIPLGRPGTGDEAAAAILWVPGIPSTQLRRPSGTRG